MALLCLLAALALSGCATGEEDPAAVSQSPMEQVHEFVEHVAAEGGKPAEEALSRRREEYEEAQREREEDPETEEEKEAAEEPAEPHEHEPGERALREG
jgi:hypothetical protein